MFRLWAEVFEGTTRGEMSQLFVEGYAFGFTYAYLQLTSITLRRSTSRSLMNSKNTQHSFVVHQISTSIFDLCNPIKHGYYGIRTNFDSIINFRSQPTNGTFMYASMKYDEPLSRWEQNLERRQWKLL